MGGIRSQYQVDHIGTSSQRCASEMYIIMRGVLSNSEHCVSKDWHYDRERICLSRIYFLRVLMIPMFFHMHVHGPVYCKGVTYRLS